RRRAIAEARQSPREAYMAKADIVWQRARTNQLNKGVPYQDAKRHADAVKQRYEQNVDVAMIKRARGEAMALLRKDPFLQSKGPEKMREVLAEWDADFKQTLRAAATERWMRNTERQLGRKVHINSSIKGPLERGDPTALAIQQLLTDSVGWSGTRQRIMDRIAEGASLNDLRRRGLVDEATFNAIAKASSPDGLGSAGNSVAMVGSLGTDVVTFSNRNLISQSILRGDLSLKALSKVYGKSGEAMIYGRIIPDIAKPGGPFGAVTDFDFAVMRNLNSSALPGNVMVEFVEGSAKERAAIAHLRKDLTPEQQKLDADTKYARFENESLRGFHSTIRGRAIFRDGQFAYRQQSILYGEGSAMYRDFGDIVGFVRNQKMQTGLNSPFNVGALEQWREVKIDFSSIKAADGSIQAISAMIDVKLYAFDLAFNSIMDLSNRGQNFNDYVAGDGFFSDGGPAHTSFRLIANGATAYGHLVLIGMPGTDSLLNPRPPGTAGSNRVSPARLHIAEHSLGPRAEFVFDPTELVVGFTSLNEAIAASLPGVSTSIANGGFDEGLASGDAPGWRGTGNASIVDGQAVLELGDRLFSDLLQTFIVPEGARSLSFTIVSATLDQPLALPPAVFEAALLNPTTGQSLVGVAQDGGDAFFHLSPNGSVRSAQGIEMVNTPEGSFRVTIDLSGVAAGTPASLFLDLAGFGGVGSRMVLDHVELSVAANEMPVATPDSYNVRRNETLVVPASLGVLGNDRDPLGRGLVAELVTGPEHGSLTLFADGSFSYTPDTGFLGTDIFLYRAGVPGGDGAGEAVQVTLTVTDDAVVSPPGFLSGGDVTVTENAGAQVIPGWATDLAAGRPAPDETAFRFIVEVDDPSLFATQQTIDPDGTLRFTPADFAFGAAQVTVRLIDGGGTEGRLDTSAPVGFTLRILPVNQAPSFAVPEDLVIEPGSTVVHRPRWVTAVSPGPENESDQSVSFSVSVDRPELFSVLPTIDAEGGLRFTLVEGASGFATLTATARDDGGRANGGSDTTERQVFLSIGEAPALVATADAYNTQEDQTLVVPVAGGVLANDVDAFGRPFVAELVAGPVNGSLDLNPDGAFTYSPNTGFSGEDVFTYRIRHGSVVSEAVTVRIAVERSVGESLPPTFEGGADITVL
ncbi:MAG: Ig-like domain-containing protein, partial [Verrucomicrobiota bacterium]